MFFRSINMTSNMYENIIETVDYKKVNKFFLNKQKYLTIINLFAFLRLIKIHLHRRMIPTK
jgi:hypothetical protein